jgi:Acyl-CoA reductase (LuxC)
MYLQQRINLLIQLKDYMESDDSTWEAAKNQAKTENGWFIHEFIELAIKNIVNSFLNPPLLATWIGRYNIPDEQHKPKNIGLIMAGNIPLVGFHDFLSVFISGHRQSIKPSSKDTMLIRHLADKMLTFNSGTGQLICFVEMMKGCDAYIATGSNNSARYFDYYLAKYPRLIRRNRSSAAILNGKESDNDLKGLADDVCQYFGLGCRNVSKIFVPKDYDFTPLLQAFGKYSWMAEHHKYRNNYDYQLTLLILNKQYYMTDGTVLLVENKGLFSPISVLNFEYYSNQADVLAGIKQDEGLQCLIGQDYLPFGKAQQPGLEDYADGADTLEFLLSF